MSAAPWSAACGRAVVAIAATATLYGCSVAVNATGATGSSHISTGAATQAHAAIGNHAGVAASFGAPAPVGAPGAHVSLSRGAAGVLILGLVVAEFVQALASPAAARGVLLDPNRPIAHTCSCYGYLPPQELTATVAAE